MESTCTHCAGIIHTIERGKHQQHLPPLYRHTETDWISCGPGTRTYATPAP